MLDLKAVFEKFDDDYLAFERVGDKLHPRPDICAFLLLSALVPNNVRDIVGSAEHDEIWLDVEVEELAEVATEADILTLVRCGVRYDSEHEVLAMYV